MSLSGTRPSTARYRVMTYMYANFDFIGNFAFFRPYDKK